VNLLLVAAGAAVGAPLRYLTDRVVQSRHDTVFPWGTFAVNVLGSFVLGVVVGATVGGGAGASRVELLVGTGFCGAFTTYSTFSYETLRLVEGGATLHGVLNVVGSMLCGLGAAFGGYALAGALWG
jgi:CrcB protein